jgi:chromosome segregation ATPase
LSAQDLQQENEKLAQELETTKADYAERLKTLEETEVAIRQDLAAKIEELHEKNEKRKEALAAATATISAEHTRRHKLRKQNEKLQNHVQELEDENAKQAVALAKAALATAQRNAASPTRGPDIKGLV